MSNHLYPLLKKRRREFYPYSIDYSGRFYPNTLRYWTPAIASTGAGRIATFNLWFKRSINDTLDMLIGGVYPTDIQNYWILRLQTDNVICFQAADTGIFRVNCTTPMVVRDTSHWYNLHCEVDTTLAAAADRVKMWVNGVSQTLTYTTNAALNITLGMLYNGWFQTMGDFSTTIRQPLNGYLANVHAFDGSKPSYDEFGEYRYGAWVPKRYIGAASYGNNGYFIEFKNPLNLGEDTSGSGNHFVGTSGNAVAQALDTPTNNYPILDSLTNPAALPISQAGLHVSSTAAGNVRGTIELPTQGVWQWETTLGSTNGVVGVIGVNIGAFGDITLMRGYFSLDGQKYTGGTGSAYGDTFTTNDVIGCIWNGDDMSLEFYKNGVSQGIAFTGLDSDAIQWAPLIRFGDANQSADINFGSLEDFVYPVEGAKSLAASNLPTPEVIDGEQGLWVNTRTGTGATVDVAGAAFDVSQKSLVWTKSRSSASSHFLFDTIRGPMRFMSSDLTNAEGFNAETLTTFLTNGFTLGNNFAVNSSVETYVDWVFNMQAKYGMDIVTWVGDGVAGKQIQHGLGAAPELIMVFNRSSEVTYHSAGCAYTDSIVPWNYSMFLNRNEPRALLPQHWNNTPPTSSVFTVGDGGSVNASGDEYVAYLFSSIPGFLRVGYYIGNGSADGPRIHTGFRPKYLLIKNTDVISSWRILDSVRDPHNVAGTGLLANTPDVEFFSIVADFLSNGFKIRVDHPSLNGNGNRIIYLAIADMPYPFCNAF